MNIVVRILLTIAVIWSGVFTISYAIWELKRKNNIGGITALTVVGVLAATFFLYMKDCL